MARIATPPLGGLRSAPISAPGFNDDLDDDEPWLTGPRPIKALPKRPSLSAGQHQTPPRTKDPPPLPRGGEADTAAVVPSKTPSLDSGPSEDQPSPPSTPIFRYTPIDFSAFEDDGGAGDYDPDLDGFGFAGYVDHHADGGAGSKKRKVPAPGQLSPLPTSPPFAASPIRSRSPRIPARASPSGKPEKHRTSPAALAVLRNKDAIKRKKQSMAAVMGALSLGDSLALESALLEAVPSAASVKATPAKTPPSPTSASSSPSNFPASEFEFACHSTISDRLASMREEVAVLSERLEAELARERSAKPPSSANGDVGASSAGNGGGGKMLVAKATMTVATQTTDPPPSEFETVGVKIMTPRPLGEAEAPAADAPRPSSKKKSSKKNRANSSNPHHVRNYVPGRTKPSATQQTAPDESTLLFPAPLRFLSADKPAPPNADPATAISPADEFLCPFCEYAIFFGSTEAMQRAVRKRKKVLATRRRARERAAAAANGVARDKGVDGVDGDGHGEGKKGKKGKKKGAVIVPVIDVGTNTDFAEFMPP